MYYIGTKLIQAERAERAKVEGMSAIRVLGEKWTEEWMELVNTNAATLEAGYKVTYSDGYVSWSPKDVFEQAYLPLEINEHMKTDAPSISQKMVDEFITGTQITTMGDKCTVVRAVLRNGFEIVESSACVSAENYDEAYGAKLCLEKIKDKVWFLLGFLLQTAVHGIKPEKPAGADATWNERKNWLKDRVKDLESLPGCSIGIAVIPENVREDDIMTAYWDASVLDKNLMADAIKADSTDQVIKANWDQYVPRERKCESCEDPDGYLKREV